MARATQQLAATNLGDDVGKSAVENIAYIARLGCGFDVVEMKVRLRAAEFTVAAEHFNGLFPVRCSSIALEVAGALAFLVAAHVGIAYRLRFIHEGIIA